MFKLMNLLLLVVVLFSFDTFITILSIRKNMVIFQIFPIDLFSATTELVLIYHIQVPFSPIQPGCPGYCRKQESIVNNDDLKMEGL